MTLTLHAAAGAAIILGALGALFANGTAADSGADVAARLGCGTCAPIRQIAMMSKTEDEFVKALSPVGARPPMPFAPGQPLLSESEIRALHQFLVSHPEAL